MAPLKKKVLAAVDGSEGSLSAVRYAGHMLKGGPAEIVLFHVLPPAPPLYRDSQEVALQQAHAAWQRKQQRAAESILAGAQGAACAAGFNAEDVQVKYQPAVIGVARDLLAEAEKGRYDAVVMGRRGLGLMEDLFIGSVSNKVLQHAGLPLWLVEGRHLALPVLVAVDESEPSRRAIDHLGFVLEGRDDIPVTLLYVQPPSILAKAADIEMCRGEEAERAFPFLAEARQELVAAGLPGAMVHVAASRRGRDAARELLHEMREGGYGTIVLGRRGLTGAKAFFLGSISAKLVSSARQMAVWIVP